jgi:hypothetical protein
LNATSDKIPASNFILVTLNNNVKKSPVATEVPLVVPVFETGLPVDETKLACGAEDGFIKKT